MLNISNNKNQTNEEKYHINTLFVNNRISNC